MRASRTKKDLTSRSSRGGLGKCWQFVVRLLSAGGRGWN